MLLFKTEKQLKILTLMLLVLIALNAKSQDTIPDVYQVKKVGVEVVDGDTLSSFLFSRFKVRATQSNDDKAKFDRLYYNVKKVLPYAQLAAFRLQAMEDQLTQIPKEKDKKAYIKETEKEIFKEFYDDLTNLTQTQGKLLLKLVHRQTGLTAWDIMKNYRNSAEAILYQGVAKAYGADMHETYDPVLDYQIESIIQSLEIEE